MKTITLHYETVACKNVDINLSELTPDQRSTVELYVATDKLNLLHSYLQKQNLQMLIKTQHGIPNILVK